MEYTIICSGCEKEINFTKKDLKKLSKSDIKVRQDYADRLIGILEGKKKKLKLFPFPHIIEEIYQKQDWLGIRKTSRQIKNQIYFIKCDICNTEIVV